MHFVAILALLFSAAVFAAPMEAMDQTDASQDVTEYPGTADFANLAEFVDWAEAADWDNMEDGSIDKATELVKKANYYGVAILQNGPRGLDTAKAILDSFKGNQAARA